MTTPNISASSTTHRSRIPMSLPVALAAVVVIAGVGVWHAVDDTTASSPAVEAPAGAPERSFPVDDEDIVRRAEPQAWPIDDDDVLHVPGDHAAVDAGTSDDVSGSSPGPAVSRGLARGTSVPAGVCHGLSLASATDCTAEELLELYCANDPVDDAACVRARR